MTILSHMQQLLEENGQICTLVKSSAEFPYDHLLLLMTIQQDKPEELLEIAAYPQQFPAALTKKAVADTYYLIQFQYKFPLQVPAAHFEQVSSSLHFFNRLLHCPGFELDELKDQILYRYSWFIKASGLDDLLLRQVIGSIQLSLALFSSYIQDIANGRQTLEQVLEQVIESAKKQSN